MQTYFGECDPDNIYFTHSKIRKRFSGCNKTLDETYDEIKQQKIYPSDIPKITVYFDGANYYSQNNRRLWLFKKCKSDGLLPNGTINVLIKLIEPDPQKYSPQKFSKHAKPRLK